MSQTVEWELLKPLTSGQIRTVQDALLEATDSYMNKNGWWTYKFNRAVSAAGKDRRLAYVRLGYRTQSSVRLFLEVLEGTQSLQLKIIEKKDTSTPLVPLAKLMPSDIQEIFDNAVSKIEAIEGLIGS